MDDGRSSSLVTNWPPFDLTLIFFVSPSTPRARPTALWPFRSL